MVITVTPRFRKDLGEFIDLVLAPRSLARGAMTANRKNDGGTWKKEKDLERIRKNTSRAVKQYRESFKRIAEGN